MKILRYLVCPVFYCSTVTCINIILIIIYHHFQLVRYCMTCFDLYKSKSESKSTEIFIYLALLLLSCGFCFPCSYVAITWNIKSQEFHQEQT